MMALSVGSWLGRNTMQDETSNSLIGEPLGGLSLSKTELERYRSMMNAYPITHVSHSGANTEDIAAIESNHWRRQAIAHRLQLQNGGRLPFDGLETLLGDDVVYIMIVSNGKGVMLEDERGLFPSDTLLTQLRLLAK